jgi:hypothetical protein
LAETKRLPLFIFAGKRRRVGGKVIPLPFPVSPAVTCYRCLVSFKDQLHLRLHRLQCPRLPSEQRDITAAGLERALGFVGTTWPRKSRMAGLLARSGREAAEAQGYQTVASWLRQEIYPRCFRSAITDLGKPTRHRLGRQWLKDESGRIAEIVPIDLPLPRLTWWLMKETRRRAEPILRDLLEATASAPGLRAHSPDARDETAAASECAEADAERHAALLRALYSLCVPAPGGPLRLRQRRLLAGVLDGETTQELQRIWGAPTRGALYAALTRLRAKLPEDLRAAFDRGRLRRKPRA